MHVLTSPRPDFREVHRIRVPDVTTVPTTDGRGVKCVEDGESDYTVEVSIDLEQIVRVLGRKAVRNRTGVARDGFVTVRRVGKGKKVS